MSNCAWCGLDWPDEKIRGGMCPLCLGPRKNWAKATATLRKDIRRLEAEAKAERKPEIRKNLQTCIQNYKTHLRGIEAALAAAKEQKAVESAAA